MPERFKVTLSNSANQYQRYTQQLDSLEQPVPQPPNGSQLVSPPAAAVITCHVDFYPNGGNQFPECQGKNSIATMVKTYIYNCDRKRSHLLAYYILKGIKVYIMKEKLELYENTRKNDDFMEYFICKNNGCNHRMATKFFIESLNPRKPRRFATSVKSSLHRPLITRNAICHNYRNSNNETGVEMGYGAEKYKAAEGAYYLITNKNYDYKNQC